MRAEDLYRLMEEPSELTEGTLLELRRIVEDYPYFQVARMLYLLKTLYWKVLNYLFLSPFIAKLRYEGDRFGYEDRFFPMYMLIYGDSDA